MSEQAEIQAVAARDQMRALEFVLAGDYCDTMVASRAQTLSRMLADRGGRGSLRWARCGKQPVAAAVVVISPGRVGMLLFSPPLANGVDGAALSAVIRASAQQALDNGLLLVQALVDEDRKEDSSLLSSAGFRLLATLVHMRLSPLIAGEGESGDLQWRSADRFDPKELEHVIAETYKGSLDCPPLAGVRPVADAIDCHKASGIYRAQSWWIVQLGQTPAGCILMNDATSSDVAEIVYLGVVPSCRGRGLGHAMLLHAQADARRRGLRAIELAVDDANVYAKRLYQSHGYRPTRRQLAFVVFHPDVEKTALWVSVGDL